MTTANLTIVCQLIVAISVLIVWIFRFHNVEKELHEQLLDKIICGFCYEINPDFRNYLRNLEI